MINKLKDLRAGGEEEGFTLIELMIVVVIIGILAAIAIPVFANQQKAAIQAGLKTDVRNTNTNVVTFLAKQPSATYEQLASSQGDVFSGVPNDNYDLVMSDKYTNIQVLGSWDNYVIKGTNTYGKNDAPTSNFYSVRYDSLTGNLTEVPFG